jgi:cyclic pyranopterin phosphate synthase
VDDSCNFRCLYCLPNGYHKVEKEPPLSVAEIRRLARAFAGLGLWKIRITGGEPTLRRDIVEIVRAVSSISGNRNVSLSTNGYRLVELAADFKRAGLSSINVSVDSLDAGRFKDITGQDKLPAVLAGIERSLELGIESVKVNVVLMRDLNEDELGRFIEWTRRTPIGVRFIELMPTGENPDFFKKHHLSAAGLVSRLETQGWKILARNPGDGPARAFAHPDHLGRVGVIAPYAKDFCATCNRLRVTSRGELRLCLFAESDFSLRPLLQTDEQIMELQESIQKLIGKKEVSHYLPAGRVGNAKHFAMMGG